ncbi:serine/threonine-protein phosphatase 6 regulatory ankyrin repeat subunit A-like [Belonocnema kinseyi]|uniref:serine/threonine-protein phosphatase 6 regulatory ankyrin repeat subunit A-like n=1 Tax=Belonocnema kinseyi TaxID=2817044 RepID=UPI00143D2BA2|nr:serine/threonine-protein phosphatase 6 regulatory ankyrin repeat subunit A-like [Belonocnema kinseyi]
MSVCSEYDDYQYIDYDDIFRDFNSYVKNDKSTRIMDLLSRNSNVSSRNTSKRETFLHIVARFGSTHVASHLIQLRADVNAQDDKGQTPLYLAIEKSEEMVKLLLDNGADVSIPNKEGATPLHRALCRSSFEIVRLLLNNISKANSSSVSEQTSRNFKTCRETVSFLLNLNMDLNMSKSKCPTLLHFVARHGDEDTFKMLPSRSKSFDINALNPDQHALIHILLDTNKETLLKKLIKSGASVNTPGSPGSILHYAVMKNNPSLVRYLLEHQADVNALTVAGRTPLHYAACIGNIEVVKMLLEAGADVNSRKCRNNITPLHEACGGSLKREALLSGSVLDYKEKSKFRNILNEEIIKLLLEYGADIEAARGHDRFTAFHDACAGSLTTANLLLKFGANIHALDTYGQTALHSASHANKLDVVDFLLNKGFDINIQDDDGDTPLSTIIRYQKKPCLETIEFLLDNGADVEVGDEEDLNAINCAGELENIEAFDCLLEFKPSLAFANHDVYLYSCQAIVHITASIASRDGNFLKKFFKLNKLLKDLKSLNLSLLCVKLKFHIALKSKMFDCSLSDICDLIKYPKYEEYDEYYQNFCKYVKYGTDDEIKTILSREGFVFHMNFRTQETFLHIIARFGSVGIADHIIMLGPDINAQDHLGRTPLYQAIKRSEEMVTLLLNKGADFNLPNNEYFTPLQQALCQGSVKMVQLLLNKIYKANLDLNSKVQSENYFKECREVVNFLSNLKIDFNITKPEYPTLLYFVARHGDEETFRLLFSKSKYFEINALNSRRDAVIHILLETNKETLAKELIDSGADVNTPGSRRSALHYAVIKNNPSLVRYLLDHQADVNALCIEGRTPLHYGVSFGNLKIVKMLLEARADVNAQTSAKSITPLYIACMDSLSEDVVTKNELDYGEKISSGEIFSLEIIKLLLERGADINARTRDGITVLHAACTGNLDVVKLLVDWGVNLHMKCKTKRTALHVAVKYKKLDIADFLISKGLLVDVADEDGNSPLRFIMGYLDEEYLDMIEFLLDNGADVLSTESLYGNNWNVLEYALSYQNFGAVESLLNSKPNLEFPKKCDGLYSFAFCDDDSCKTLNLTTAFIALRGEDISSYTGEISEEDEELFEWVEPYFVGCKLEIERMKNERICDTRDVSYLDFLTEDLFRVTAFSRNELLMKMLESLEYENKFPSYAFIFEKRIQRVNKLRTCVDMVEDFLSEYAKVDLPMIVLGKILSYLSASDVRNFGRALSGRRK